MGDELLGRGGGRGLLTGSFGGVGLDAGRLGTGEDLAAGGGVLPVLPSCGVVGAAFQGGGPEGFGGAPWIEGSDLMGGRPPDRITGGPGDGSRLVFLNGGLGGDLAALGTGIVDLTTGGEEMTGGGASLATSGASVSLGISWPSSMTGSLF